MAGQAVAVADIAQPPAGVLSLRTGDAHTTAGTNLLLTRAAAKPGGRYVVQLQGPMTPERQAEFARAGVALGGYLPDNAWVVKLDAAGDAAVRALPFVAWLGEYRDEWKIDPELDKRAYQTNARQMLQAGGECQVVVVVFDGETPDEALNAIADGGGRLLPGGVNQVGTQWMIDAAMTPGAARALAATPSVQFVEDAPEATTRNDSNRWILQSNVLNATPVWNAGITGVGQVAGLIDGTPRESHCRFDDVVAPGPSHRKFIGWRNTGSNDSHGTHTAGTVAGDSAPYGVYNTGDGMAFGARISFSGLNAVVSNPSSFVSRLQDQHADGARVHSNSWGDDGTTAYTSWCRQIDLHTWNNEDDVVAFAVTNQGSLKTPENSINVLAVGASRDTPSQQSHCSGGTGPTADGRRKPEIYAPGCGTTSASSSSSCGDTSLTGTSMACPAVSGAGLLVRQYYTDGFYPGGMANASDAFVPSGALIRATLLNSTVDMTGVTGYPSNLEGWGRLLLDNALYFPGDARRMTATDVRNAQGLTTGQEIEQQALCNSAGQPLRFTLVWTGPPANVGVSNPVINNLDLEVVAPGGAVYKGNVFASGQSTTGGNADLKNNVEQVLLMTPATGLYTVRVRATAVNQGPQGYALVVTGDIGAPCGGPGIDTPPASQSVAEGQPVWMSVAASGDPTSFQWRRNGAPLANDGHRSGVTTSTLVISAATLDDAGSYDVVVTNACTSLTSPAAQLDVFDACPADLDDNGVLGVPDIFAFLPLWFAYDLRADWTGDNEVNVLDIFAYLTAWFAGC